MSRRRKLVIALLIMLALVGVVAGFAWHRINSYADNIERIPNAFPEPQGRPHELTAAKGSLTVLLVGSDSRATGQTTGNDATDETFRPGAQRTDTIMLVHRPRGRQKAYVISIPRDSWVDVPGLGMAKINAGFSYGGPPLLIETVEQLTDVRIDHLAIIDFEGFRSMTAALGGVDVVVRETTSDSANDRTWAAGRHHLEGDDALDFVRQRYGLPNGDLDRVQRQQSFIRALMAKAVSRGTLTNPFKLDDFLSAATKATSVDDQFSTTDMRSLAFSLRGMRTDDVVFLTAPVSGMGREGAQSVVYLDPSESGQLWRAIRRDAVQKFVASSGANDVSSVR
jgi:LCP family protein required for cell wall assembly